jgi:hypothetical protein
MAPPADDEPPLPVEPPFLEVVPGDDCEHPNRGSKNRHPKRILGTRPKAFLNLIVIPPYYPISSCDFKLLQRPVYQVIDPHSPIGLYA